LDLYEEKYLAFDRGSFQVKDWEDIQKKLVTHIPAKSARITTQCCDTWGKMKKKYFQEKTAEGVTSFATTSWVWFNRMNQILEGATKVDGTPNGLDHGYVHTKSFQAPNIEKDLPCDDTSPSQVGNAPPQSAPSIIHTFGTSVDTSSMGTQGNTTTELLHTRATNLPGVSGKDVGNKRRRLSGDMAFTFKKLTESSERIETLKLELQREAIETTKFIAQSMIAIKKRSKNENREQTSQLAQIFAPEFKAKHLFDVQKN
jgi:hypothetical protein